MATARESTPIMKADVARPESSPPIHPAIIAAMAIQIVGVSVLLIGCATNSGPLIWTAVAIVGVAGVFAYHGNRSRKPR